MQVDEAQVFFPRDWEIKRAQVLGVVKYRVSRPSEVPKKEGLMERSINRKE